MTDTQKEILKGTINTYESQGELVSTNLFSTTDLNALIEAGKIKIVKNPYGVGDDFFGITGKKYIAEPHELMKFRSMRRSFGDPEMARNLCNCIEL